MDEVITNMTAPVHCTGITLSASALTFNGEGTQTITATVTPDGCTDAITWSSDNETIATVENGVVTAIANGTANITATCGEYSASCTVTVSGVERNILAGVGWNSGYLRGSGGSIGASAADAYTDAIDISGLSKLIVSYTYASNPGANVNRLCFYDVEDISGTGWKSLPVTQATHPEQRVLEADIPEGAKYARLSFQLLNSGADIGFGGITIQETEGGEVIGRLVYP
jgi:hypothetical protein